MIRPRVEGAEGASEGLKVIQEEYKGIRGLRGRETQRDKV